MSDLRVKLFAASCAEELESQVNGWLAGRGIKLEGFDFIADGADLSYNCMMLYQEEEGGEKDGLQGSA